jgi:serine/threonine protein kinase
MARSENEGTGDSGKQRPQAPSRAPARKPEATSTAANRGDTAGPGRSGPTDLPARFGRYRVLRKLGGGGMGTVYLVENTDLEREEALKVPHFTDGDDPQLRERFLREAKSAARLDHANLCPVYDAGVQDGIYYMTMRFLQGKLLSEYTRQPQPARKAVEIVARLAQALEAAHGKGVIHRDLKPSNVMMVGGVGPVVMDFGLAKQVRQADQKLTQAGSALGTPAYMPPEQVNGDLGRMGPASDVYSLGVILFELLTGQLPFEGPTAAVFGQILYAEPPLPSALAPGLDPALDGICRKAMAKAPGERYPSMKAFAAALLDFLRQAPATEGGGNPMPTGVDQAAGSPTSRLATGPPPEGEAAISRTPRAAPEPPATAPVRPRPVKPATVVRKRSRPIARRSKTPWLAALAALAAGATLVVGLLLLAIVIWAGKAGPPDVPPVVLGNTTGDSRPLPPPAVVRLLPVADLTLVQGQRKTLDVRLERDHCQRPLELNLEDLPRGVQAARCQVPADGVVAQLELTVSADAPPGRTSVRLVALGADQPASLTVAITVVRLRGATLDVRTDPGTLRGYRDEVGKSFYFEVTGNKAGTLYGSDIYSDDSSLATAAVHAGILKDGQKGAVKVTILEGKNSYQESTRNGVTSSSWGAWDGSFRVEAVDGLGAIRVKRNDVKPDPGNLREFRGEIGKSFYFEVTGTTAGSVWGTDIYTDDSRLAVAAVHAGVLKDGQTGVVKVTILEGKDSYQESTRNGVSTSAYDSWLGSYRVEAVKE